MIYFCTAKYIANKTLESMNRNKYKVLVLSDLKENAKETIQYAIKVSREINGALELLCVKKPKDVITTDNPLSAMRTVSTAYIKTEEKARALITEITKNNFFPVKRVIEFGNVKNEIENYIQASNPDIIILGKKKKQLLKLNKDNITNFVAKKYTHKTFIPNTNSISDVFIALNQQSIKEQTA